MQKIFRKKIISHNSINYGLFRINDKGKRPFLLFYGVVYLLILSNIPTEHNVSVKEETPLLKKCIVIPVTGISTINILLLYNIRIVIITNILKHILIS